MHQRQISEANRANLPHIYSTLEAKQHPSVSPRLDQNHWREYRNPLVSQSRLPALCFVPAIHLPKPVVAPSSRDCASLHSPDNAPENPSHITRRYCPPRRGSSFTSDEDAAIARAWISASENPVVGSEQTGEVFYRKITTLYNESFKPANREMRSLESIRARTKAIHKQCARFSGCYTRVLRSKPTGVSPDDLLRLATAIFNDISVKNANDDCGKAFKFLSAWNILKEHDKFAAAASEKNDIKTSAAPGDSNNGDKTDDIKPDSQHSSAEECGSTASGRPMGRRKAKEMQSKERLAQKKLKLAAELLKTQQDRNAAILRDIDIRLFTNSPPGCSETDSIDFFNILRKEALSRYRQNEASKNGEDGNTSSAPFNPSADDSHVTTAEHSSGSGTAA